MGDGMETVEEALAGARARAAAVEERLRSQTMLRAEAEHRLKTSLAVIAGWATTLDERWDQLSEERRREGVSIIRRAGDELADQATRLLEDARAELLTLDPAPITLDLAAVLAVTTAAFGGLSGGHVVEYVPVAEPLLVEVDPAALQQILGHLIENAVKYSADGTKVMVRAFPDGLGGVLLEVRDEGIGIPEDIDMFAPFLRGSATDRRPGVGLGLYIVRNLVGAMGGEVTARRNERVGSTFTVRLPGAR
jgi:signal transduction histidine kinase